MSPETHTQLKDFSKPLVAVHSGLSPDEYPLEQGLEHVREIIRAKLTENFGNIVILVAGGSSSGKTSAVTEAIRNTFPNDTAILSSDDYYKGKKFMNSEAEKGNILNWDQPEALDLELLRSHLHALKKGHTIIKPQYSMAISEPVGMEEVSPQRVIISEGLFNLDETMQDEGDLRVFVNISRHGRIIRRLLRDIERTGDSPESIIRYFAEVVEPMHEKYIEPTKNNADIVINNDYSADIESVKCQTNEVQIKFPWSREDVILPQAGINKLNKTVQKDHYYTSNDRNLASTGEVVRIRETGERIFLTYKGPLLDSPYRKRPSLTFEINNATKELFLSLYGSLKQTITKESTAYSINGVRCSIDHVVKEENGTPRDLGSFLEIQSDDENQIEQVIHTLGLSSNAGVHASYTEM